MGLKLYIKVFYYVKKQSIIIKIDLKMLIE